MTKYNPQPGDRVLVVNNGVQFAGTVDNENYVVSDIDGSENHTNFLDSITKLTGVRAAKVGDIIADGIFTRKVLEIGNSHNAVLLSASKKFTIASTWYTFDELERCGYILKSQTPTETIELNGKKYRKEDIDKLEAVDE